MEGIVEESTGLSPCFASVGMILATCRDEDSRFGYFKII
jgi:hypothetical protein